MASTFRLQIITQQGLRYDGQVETVQARSVDGYFGLRPRHAPMVAELVPGELDYREPGNALRCYACSGGILEVSTHGVVVLADAVEAASEIDVDRAQQAVERARARLQERRDPHIDLRRAEISLQKALNRMRAAHKGQP
jgi:F-type H+-transporting ATPase subunit epsilon